MAKIIDNADMIAKASRGYIENYYTSPGPNSKEPDSLKPVESLKSLELLMYDDTFNSEVNTLVDAILKKGYKIINRENITKRDSYKERKFYKKYRSRKYLKKLVINAIVYRNAFTEIEYKNNKVVTTHVLETTEMNINMDAHGELRGYTQEPLTSGSSSGSTQSVFFPPEECIHLTTPHLSSNPWGFIDTRAVENIIATKQRMERYIDSLFANNTFRNLWNIVKPSGSQQVKNFIDSIRQGKDYPDKDIVIEGEVNQKPLQTMAEFDLWLNMYREYKDSIRKFLRLPAIMSGGAESNKSSAEFQVRSALENVVKGWQNNLEDYLSNDLFPLIGWGDFELKFFVNDVPNEEKFINMAVQLKGLGYDANTINKFLHEKNVELPEGAKIEEPEEVDINDDSKSAEEISKQSLQNKNAPSRQASDKSLETTNVSEDVTTREEQIIGKAKKSDISKYNKYPYVM